MDTSEKKIKGRILVVDDEERICEAVKKALNHQRSAFSPHD